LRASQHSRLPVSSGVSDEIIGVLVVRRVFEALALGASSFDLKTFVAEVPIVSDLAGATDVIAALRNSTQHMALVYDEYGHFEGIVTSGDILEAITGSFREEGDEEPSLLQREDGSFLVAGWTPIDEFADR